MNIGILTFQRSCSYGAFLQCFALQEYLKSSGHNVSVIDYQPRHRVEKYRYGLSMRPPFFARSNVKLAIDKYTFGKAIREKIQLSEVKFKTKEHLQSVCLGLDAVVCGSDQIWNAAHTGGSLDPVYFGEITKERVKRISYAASLGGGGISNEHEHRFRELVCKMDSVSVREEVAQEEILIKCGREVTVVPDPTILYDLGTSLLSYGKSEERSPYVFSFQLQQSQLYHESVKRISSALRFPICHLGSALACGTRSMLGVSPVQWLNYIRSASHVVTNSFHCAVFAIIFGRPLTVVALNSNMAARNGRMKSLLDRLKMNTCMCYSNEDILNCLDASQGIDWETTRLQLESQRQVGVKFLENALGS